MGGENRNVSLSLGSCKRVKCWCDQGCCDWARPRPLELCRTHRCYFRPDSYSVRLTAVSARPGKLPKLPLLLQDPPLLPQARLPNSLFLFVISASNNLWMTTSSTSTDNDSESKIENEIGNPSPIRSLALWSERRSTHRLYQFVLFALVKEGSVRPFTFVSKRKLTIPSRLYSQDSPSNPFAPSLADSGILNSFRSTNHRNVKVLITKGSYGGKHGVIVKSYILGKNSHRVLTSDGSINTFKQIDLKRLDVQFLLPYSFPVEYPPSC